MIVHLTKIQRFSNHDGPGVRTVVFLAGCPLSCAWCHNPETQSSRAQLLFCRKNCVFCGACTSACSNNVHMLTDAEHILQRENCAACGKCAEVCPTGALSLSRREADTEEILQTVLRDRPFYGGGGGMTLSGGEPLLQRAGTVALLSGAKKEGLHTAVETCGFAERETFDDIRPYTDLLLFDVKDTDAARHERMTGQRPEKILENLRYADSLGIPVRLRCIQVKTVNDFPEHWARVRQLRKELRHCTGIDVLPYHTYGSDKSVELGRAPDAREEWIPTPEETERVRAFLRETD